MITAININSPQRKERSKQVNFGTRIELEESLAKTIARSINATNQFTALQAA